MAESKEEIEERQRKERKELQGKITALKHSSNNANKKKKKEVADEIARLEAEMKEKHQVERQSADTSSSPSTGESTEDQTTAETQENNTAEKKADEKVSKAQKRRVKKEAKDKQTDKLNAEAEILSLSGVRHKETVAVIEILRKRSLQLKEIPADGDCLYNAILHQLMLNDQVVPSSVAEIRKITADFLRGHMEDFLPFMIVTEGNDEIMDEPQFRRYCDKVERTKAWGGQPEIKAISSALKRPIEVIQAAGSPLLAGEEHPNSHLVITYHRHAYRLGEHYNSTEPMKEVEET